MGRFFLRRLGQAALTIFGVMIIVFLLFRVVAGDIAAIYAGEKVSEQYKADWRHRHGYDLPLVLNLHQRLRIESKVPGTHLLRIEDAKRSRSQPAGVLGLIPSDDSESVYLGRYVFALSEETPLEKMTGALPMIPKPRVGRKPDLPIMTITVSDKHSFKVDLSGCKTCGDVIRRINDHPDNRIDKSGRTLVKAEISEYSIKQIFKAQFWPYLWSSLTFQSESLEYKKKLTEIIAQRAPKSLALTIPTMAIGWFFAMVIACFVAYYRGTWLDKIGVFLSVLGMCIPFLAFMILGQWAMFKISPDHAYGLEYRANIYVPILIMVVASLGGSVRFYRTVILDETNRDYVRTARAKGVPLPGILFKHVLRNCMLPILTNLILAIPFLFMGNLLVESYFGIPGLGDLLLTSINNGDEPVMTGLVFLTALIYTIGLLITDLSYAMFDPRVRLR